MTKRVLHRIRLDKIAAVDKPCQEHATVAIIKRAPQSDMPSIVKKTFEQALSAQLVSDQVSDVFWRAFENQWAVRDAFRVALTDEIAEGGDGSEATEGFAAAMQALASAAAEAARNAASTADTDLEGAVEEAVSKWLQQQEQPMKILNKAQLQKAVADFDANKSPAAHVAIIQKAAADLGLETELPAEGVLAKAAPVEPNNDLAQALDQITILKMDADTRAHFDGLAETDQTAFLEKSDDERTAIVKAANESDPVLYTTSDGTPIRKSDGGAALSLAKRQDALEKENAELRAGVSKATLGDRAAAEFPNVAKAVAVDMLTSIEKVGVDTETGKAMQKSLVAMNAVTSGLFDTLGTTEGGAPSGDLAKARTDFNSEVEKVAADRKIVKSAATSIVRQENPELYAEAYPEVQPAEAE